MPLRPDPRAAGGQPGLHPAVAPKMLCRSDPTLNWTSHPGLHDPRRAVGTRHGAGDDDVRGPTPAPPVACGTAGQGPSVCPAKSLEATGKGRPTRVWPLSASRSSSAANLPPGHYWKLAPTLVLQSASGCNEVQAKLSSPAGGRGQGEGGSSACWSACSMARRTRGNACSTSRLLKRSTRTPWLCNQASRRRSASLSACWLPSTGQRTPSDRPLFAPPQPKCGTGRRPGMHRPASPA